MKKKSETSPSRYDEPAAGPPLKYDDLLRNVSSAQSSAVPLLRHTEASMHAFRQLNLNLTDQPITVDPFPTGLEPGTVHSGGSSPIIEIAFALQAIDRKASELGHATDSALSEIIAVPGGYVVHYEGQDIYYSTALGAHEVHGDIKSKYDILMGASGRLGMPITDETGTPDGRGGRYNHFANGSIYWSPTTGPMAVYGAIRDRWAANAWESGSLGYPVAHQYTEWRSSPTDPVIEVCLFENGAIVSDTKIAKVACYAEVKADDLRSLVRKLFDDAFHESPDNVGLHPGIESTGVAGWQYGGIWKSVPRSVGFRLRGFHDAGAAPDTDFIIDIALGFGGVTYTGGFIPPPYLTLVASKEFLRVTIEPGDVSVGASVVRERVENGIHDRFFPKTWPDPNHSEVPFGCLFIHTFGTGANPRMGLIDLIGIVLAADGSLRFILNPLTPPSPPNAPQPPFINPEYCQVRRTIAQAQVDTFVQNALGQ